MAFMSVYNFAVGVAVEGNEIRGRTVGRSVTSSRGDRSEARRSTKLDGAFVTAPLKRDTADALERILAGDWHLFSFNGHYASSGGAGIALPRQAGFSIGSLTVAGPFSDTWRAKVNSGTFQGFKTVLTGPSGPWTILVSASHGSGWSHYARRSDTQRWKAGVKSAGTWPFLTVGSGGDVQLEGKNEAGASTTTYFTELAVFPYLLSDEILNAWTNRGFTNRMVDPPRIRVTGDFISPRPAAVVRFDGIEADFVARSVGTEQSRRVLSFSMAAA